MRRAEFKKLRAVRRKSLIYLSTDRGKRTRILACSTTTTGTLLRPANALSVPPMCRRSWHTVLSRFVQF